MNSDGHVPVKGLPGLVGAEHAGPVVVVDVRGLEMDNFDDHVLKGIKIPGRDVWMLTHIDCIEDLLDSFIGNINCLLVPYNTVCDEMLLEDIYEMSDDSIPTLFVTNGKCNGPSGKITVTKAVEKLHKIGFHRLIIIDTDGSLTDDDWNRFSYYEGIMPFARTDVSDKFDNYLERFSFQ